MRMRTRIRAVCAALLAAATAARAEQRFPPPEFESGHVIPATVYTLGRPPWTAWVDVAALATALGLAAFFVLRLRSRKAVTWLSLASIAYFGFYRRGCTCPIGAIQDVARAAADPTFFLPLTVALFFALPLLFSIFFGRVFCGGVCPLGAIQDVVLVRPLRVPGWLEQPLGMLPWVYLGAAVLFAATGTLFVICRYDPFVAFFRLNGPAGMLAVGAGMLLLSTVVGRPYCRFACPYGALLGLCSRAAWKRATITPDTCVDCSLCREACAFGAIRVPAPASLEERR